MSDAKRDPLDAALARLPREVQPSRDLWPAIEAELSKPAERVVSLRPRRAVVSSPWMQLAAAVLLVAGTAVTTYELTRDSTEQTTTIAVPAATAVPVSLVQQEFGAGYLGAREQLEALYKERIASLPPGTRAKLDRDLVDLRRAAAEISAILAKHPEDPLLQDLLMSTYQSELDLLSDVGEMTAATAVRKDL
jgi:hypothetical protein